LVQSKYLYNTNAYLQVLKTTETLLFNGIDVIFLYLCNIYI